MHTDFYPSLFLSERPRMQWLVVLDIRPGYLGSDSGSVTYPWVILKKFPKFSVRWPPYL